VTVKRGHAHSASGEETAAETAVAAWLKIKAYVDSFNTDKPRAFDKLLITLRGMESDTNDFEQWARLKIGCRLPVEVSPDGWYAKLNEIADGNYFQSDCHLSVEPIGFALPAWECEKNTPLVRAFLSGIRALGGKPIFVYKTGTADLNVLAPVWKCPAVVYGPGDSGLDHTPNEHISLDEYAKAVNVLQNALKGLAA